MQICKISLLGLLTLILILNSMPSQAVSPTKTLILTAEFTTFTNDSFVFTITNNTNTNFDYYLIEINNVINYTIYYYQTYPYEIYNVPAGVNNATAYAYENIGGVPTLTHISNTVYFQNDYTVSVSPPHINSFWFFSSFTDIALFLWSNYPLFVIFSIPVIIGVWALRKTKNGVLKNYK